MSSNLPPGCTVGDIESQWASELDEAIEYIADTPKLTAEQFVERWNIADRLAEIEPDPNVCQFCGARDGAHHDGPIVVCVWARAKYLSEISRRDAKAMEGSSAYRAEIGNGP